MPQSREAYLEQLEELEATFREMGDIASTNVRASGKAVVEGDVETAERIINKHNRCLRLRHTIEDRCMSLMLLQQPMASDLRFVTAAFRSVSDLGRIGEMTLDIAEIVEDLPRKAAKPVNGLITELADGAADMVEQALTGFLNSDADAAEKVFGMDDRVDSAFMAVRDSVVKGIRKDDKVASYAPEILTVAKYYERIGDHAQSFADWAIFRATGTYNGQLLGTGE
ncbi:MAG: phosphate signaling complex protein PhoU [Atopobiaceae bacterium]|jgi:phosphate transport system protein|nr:phosphate signaling complex protein PhoU [Atopobiaceae bacterium]MCH4119515.1 phosphate signaling complex protein PhoU [Atopobiaceae bacterium]MCI1389600.1 phosphate signaling complex protein PhoU [Atopobiaceae bacterium]MCI1431664.1 phosphate signaling complex protein PhoU [Atopobiaceae bacterium]MCI1470100.1 phosphate signaling complex protein PhoU [Atopobiaceae bacterium]